MNVSELLNRLVGVGSDVMGFVNRFHRVRGFDHVLSDYLRRDGNFSQGARYVMRYVEHHVPQVTEAMLDVNRPQIAFEVAIRGRRRIDLILNGVRHEFKSVREFQPRRGRSGLGPEHQLRRDISALLSQTPFNSRGLRWIFDRNQLGRTRSDLLREMAEEVHRQFENHPRLNEIIGWLDEIVVVW